MPALLGLAPEVVLGVMMLAALCSYLAMRGALTGWQHTFGMILVGRDGNGGLAGLLRYSTSVFHRHIGFDFGGPIRAANTAIVNTLEARVADAEEAMAWTWHKMGQVWQATAEAVNWLSHETAATAEWLAKSRLPKWSKYAVIPLLLPLLIPKVIRAILPHLHAGAIHTIQTVTHTITRVVVHTAVKAAAIAVPGVIGIPKIWHEIHGLTKRNLRLAKRLHRLEALIGAAAFAGLMANALGLSVRCLRPGGNVYRSLRHICGLPKWMLDFALLGTMEAFVAADLCDFTDLLITTTEGLRPALMEFVDVEGVLLGCHGNTAPRALALPAVSLPSLVDAVALAA